MRLYICSEPQDNKSNIKNVIYESNQLNEENYFIGSVSNITYDEVYFYVVGYGEIEEVLYSSTLEMNLPQEWVTNTNPILDFNKNIVSCSNDSNVMMIEGTYSYYDSTKNLEVCVNEYDSLGNIIKEENTIPLVIDDNNKRFSFSFEAKCGNK